jgi:aromatic-L-amino-acid/L-tryptophan decarboxylase
MQQDMSSEEFRRAGHDVVDWIAGYLANVRDYPVVTPNKPGDLIEALPKSGPEAGELMETILADFRNQVVPDITHWNHPRFFAYFSVSASGPGILGEMLAAALNVNGMLWKSCPAVTELEHVTLEWLRQWLGLPEGLFGIIYDTASISTMTAIAAAREAAFPEVRTDGGLCDAIVYTSEQAHSSIEKGAITLGIGQRNVRKIGVDAEFRMRPELLAAAIQDDRRAGRKPFCICATVGTTSTSSIDPVPAIADIAEREKLWLHVDAAYGGSAAIVPEMQHVLAGAERADSVLLNPHKWLFTPIDISVLYTRKPAVLKQAFSLVPEYLRTEEDSHYLNYMDYGVQLGRRFRALKFWFVMRYFGREGMVAILREHLRLAQELARWIKKDARFELAAPVPFSLVCFRLKDSNERNQKLLDDVNQSGKAFLSHTVLNGKFALRFAIGNIKTTQADVAETWALIQRLSS